MAALAAPPVLRPLVFLDIDGVLLPIVAEDQRCRQCGEVAAPGRPVADGSCPSCRDLPTTPASLATVQDPRTRFPRRCLAALERILRETEAEVVLSSTWRCVDEARQEILTQFHRFGGVLAHVPALDRTTDLANHSVRQWELAEFLRQQPTPLPSWCALDDDESVSCDPRFPWCAAHAVQTDSGIGLTDADATRAIDILSSGGGGSGGGSPADPPRTRRSGKQRKGTQRPAEKRPGAQSRPAPRSKQAKRSARRDEPY